MTEGLALSDPFSLSPSAPTTDAFLTPREQFTMTRGGIILTTVTGSLSAICSLLLLNVIRMSNQKLSTTYHRIMVLMSVFDLIASVCMALTTLPMPSDDELRFAGPMLGNKVTCQIQGYFVQLGVFCGISFYSCLIWYFVCRMTFKVSSDKVSRRIEPIFIMYSVFAGLFMTTLTLSRDAIHTTPRNSFCVFGPEHSGCYDRTIDEEYLVCDPDEYENFSAVLGSTNYFGGINTILTVFAVMIIIWTIFTKRKYNARMSHVPSDDQATRNAISELSDNGEADNEMNLAELRHDRVLVTQALLYILAYFITYLPTLLPIMLNLDASGIDLMMAFKSIFFPMQGFWNLLIFLYDKAYLVRHSGAERKSCCEAIRMILLYSPDAVEISIPASVMNEDRNSQEHEIYTDPDEDRNVNVDSYGLRRTMTECVNTLTKPNYVKNSVDSIESPGGFVSHSVESSYWS